MFAVAQTRCEAQDGEAKVEMIGSGGVFPGVLIMQTTVKEPCMIYRSSDSLPFDD